MLVGVNCIPVVFTAPHELSFVSFVVNSAVGNHRSYRRWFCRWLFFCFLGELFYQALANSRLRKCWHLAVVRMPRDSYRFEAATRDLSEWSWGASRTGFVRLLSKFSRLQIGIYLVRY
jgi:hypothetical protein